MTLLRARKVKVVIAHALAFPLLLVILTLATIYYDGHGGGALGFPVRFLLIHRRDACIVQLSPWYLAADAATTAVLAVILVNIHRARGLIRRRASAT